MIDPLSDLRLAELKRLDGTPLTPSSCFSSGSMVFILLKPFPCQLDEFREIDASVSSGISLVNRCLNELRSWRDAVQLQHSEHLTAVDESILICVEALEHSSVVVDGLNDLRLEQLGFQMHLQRRQTVLSLIGTEHCAKDNQG